MKAFDELAAFAEQIGAPVVEGQGALFRNFPKSHDLYLGQSIEPLLEADRSRPINRKSYPLVFAEQYVERCQYCFN